MSHHWTVACIDCDKELDLHGNHQEGPALAIAADAEKLTAVGRLLPNLVIDPERSYNFYCENSSKFPVSFFVDHAGHQIVARDEYGEVSGRCGEHGSCGECGGHFICNLGKDHPGRHEAGPSMKY